MVAVLGQEAELTRDNFYFISCPLLRNASQKRGPEGDNIDISDPFRGLQPN